MAAARDDGGAAARDRSAPKRSLRLLEAAMEETTTTIDRATEEELRIHDWRAEQLERLGIPGWLAEAFADRIDWHEIAALVERGCAPRLALEIVR
jgi:hypothetical protein